MNFRAENNEIHHGFQMTFQNGWQPWADDVLTAKARQ